MNRHWSYIVFVIVMSTITVAIIIRDCAQPLPGPDELDGGGWRQP